MNIGIVIVAHGGLAQEYLSVLTEIVGPQSDMRAIAMEAGHDRAAKQQEICAAADDVDSGAGVVIVVDMYGASPSNLSILACRPDNRRILYGMNLPMLVKLAKSRHLGVAEAAGAAAEAGRKYIDSRNISEE